MSWLEDPAVLVATWPAFVVPLVVFLSAYLEYVFPPIPGDTLILLGFFLAGHGAAEPAVIFAAAFVGATLGAGSAFLLGRRYGSPLLERFATWSGQEAPTHRLRRLFGLFGEKVLALNRFLPFMRIFLLYAAGASAQRFGRSMVWTAVSNLLFVGLLGWIGNHAASSWEEIQAAFRTVGGGMAALAVALVVVWWIGRAWWQRRRPEHP